VTYTLSRQWSLVLRGDLPYVAKDKYTDNNPNGDFFYGLGDADVQAALIDKIDERWKAGAGVRLIAPTGDAALGSGKWQIMPIVGARYALPEISSGSYFEPLLRYDASFAGDPTRKSINNLQFAPMINLSLPDRWFLTLYPSPDIRWNFGPAVTRQTGRLFLPIDVRVGRNISDTLAVSLEVGAPVVKQYPVYDFITQARLNLTF
jgi:Putative MetA-pathway of phenol degradation